MRIVPVPCLKDNYAYLVISERTREAAVVDVSEAEPVLEAAQREGVKLVSIWSTHHHLDHVGGNEALMAKVAIGEVSGHASDRGRIPAQNRFLETGDTVQVGDLTARATHIPGHTLGAVSYFIESNGERAVFTGDTLFLAGCGRLFEGTPAQMHTSLTALAALPPDTRVYCGHEYTASNLRFAHHVEPSNADVTRALEDAVAAGEGKRPTVPGTLARELAINPFLRVTSAEIRKTLDIDPKADAVAALAAIRKAKDGFKG